MAKPVALKYRAFITSHVDASWAKWLQAKLEGFHVDKDLVGRDTALGIIPKTLHLSASIFVGVSALIFAASLTASADTTARLWDAATGKQLHVLQGHERLLQTAVFSPDGKLVLTASADKTARIWDAANGETLQVLQGHEGPVNTAVFSPNGMRVLTASDDKTARIWDPPPESCCRCCAMSTG